MTTLADAIAALPVSYSPGFLALINFVFPHEVEFEPGHYGDYDFVRTEHDPNDPGGTTRYGLDAESHPHLDIESLTFAQAVAEYLSDTWSPLRGDQLPTAVALALCDSAINCGLARSVKWLQTIVGATADGNLGPETLTAILAQDPLATADALNARRDYYYRNEVRQSLRDEYLVGWEARVADLGTAIAALPAAVADDPASSIPSIPAAPADASSIAATAAPDATSSAPQPA